MIFQNTTKRNGYEIALYECKNGFYRLIGGSKRRAGRVEEVGVLIGPLERLVEEGTVIGTKNPEVVDYFGEKVVLVR